jgi:peptidoglycan-associated lipoprotein
MRRATPLALGIAVLVIAAACGGNPPPQAPQPNADSLAAAEAARRDSLAREQARRDSIEAARRAEEERIRRASEDSLAALRSGTEAVRGMVTAMVHFDFDKADIRPADAQVLDQKLAVLQANPGLTIEIVGHCDERGSDEYNLALGNRRALSAKQYLVSRGIDAGRISTRSMGEEQPVNPGHDETAWAQNRRDEFGITAGGDVLMRPPGM